MPPDQKNNHPLSAIDADNLEDIESDVDFTSLDELEWELNNMNGRASVTPPERDGAAELAAIDNMLEDLDLDDVGVEASDEMDDPDVIEDISEDEERALQAEAVRNAAYRMQDEEADEAAVDMEAPEKVAEPPKVRAVKRTTTASAAPIVRDLSALPAELFVLFKTQNLESFDDLENNKRDVMTLRPTAKKVGEKFDNLFISLGRNVLPSTTVVQCFQKLLLTGVASSADLITHLRTTSGYTPGTASAQAQQVMALFPAVGLAHRKGSTLELNADSCIAERLKALLA